MTHFIRSLRILLSSFVFFSLFGCAAFPQPKMVTILHTNDMHAAFIPHEAGWVKTTPKPMVGGFRQLGWLIDSLRKVKGNVLLLDAGDVMTGLPISEFEYRGAFGGALFEMMNMMGYDAWTIGNHDLDISQDNLRKLTTIAKFPTVSANLTDSAGNYPLNNKQYVIIERGGLHIGIIGIMSKDLFRLTNTRSLQGLKVTSPIAATQKLIDELSPKTDLLIALTHEGADEDSVLAAATHGLNIIVGGHSHTRLKTPNVVNGVYIVQTGSNCESLGELDLTVDQKKVTSCTGKLISLWARRDLPEDTLSRFVNRFKEEVEKSYGEVVGTLETDWRRSRNGESQIGKFVADAIREGAQADLAVTNSSGIRKDLPAGKITRLDLFELSPFRNYLCTMTLSGKQVRGLIERYLESLVDGRTSLDFSGVECSWKSVGGKVVIEGIMVNGKPIADEGTYKFATSDFVLNQADKYLGFVPTAANYSQATISDALVAKAKNDKVLKSEAKQQFTETH